VILEKKEVPTIVRVDRAFLDLHAPNRYKQTYIAPVKKKNMPDKLRAFMTQPRSTREITEHLGCSYSYAKSILQAAGAKNTVRGTPRAPGIWALLLLLATALHSLENEVPCWVLAGIMAQETRSSYAIDGDTIIYVDRRVGAAGERGPYQMRRIAWQQIKQPGERFENIATDMRYAELCAMRYLLWLYNNSAKGSWPHAIQYYNAGPGRLNYKYYANVVNKARRAGYVD
jgi:hypothetical protein